MYQPNVPTPQQHPPGMEHFDLAVKDQHQHQIHHPQHAPDGAFSDFGNVVMDHHHHHHHNPAGHVVQNAPQDLELHESVLRKDTPEFFHMLSVENYTRVTLERFQGKDVNADTFRKEGFIQPFVVPTMDGLDMEIPSDIGVTKLTELIGNTREVPVLEVGTQTETKMTMQEWVEYWEHKQGPCKIVTKFEVSRCQLAACIMTPKVVRDLDWTDQIWPGGPKHIVAQQTKIKYPRTQLYCMMSVAGGYTDYQVSISGSASWVHIVSGSILYYFIDPTDEHVRRYHDWIGSSNKNAIYFADHVGYENIQVTRVSAGETLFIPGGWIFATFTPAKTFAFHGMFLHGLSTETQLRIYKLEKQNKIPKANRFPHFVPMCWYAAKSYVMALRRVMEEIETETNYDMMFTDFDKWIQLRKPFWRNRRAKKYDHKAKTINGPPFRTWQTARKVMWYLHRLSRKKSRSLLDFVPFPDSFAGPSASGGRGSKAQRSKAAAGSRATAITNNDEDENGDNYEDDGASSKTPPHNNDEVVLSREDQRKAWLNHRKKLWRLQRVGVRFVEWHKGFVTDSAVDSLESCTTNGQVLLSEKVRETLRQVMEDEGVHSPHDIAHFVPSVLLRKLVDEKGQASYRFATESCDAFNDEGEIEEPNTDDIASDLKKLQNVELSGLPFLFQNLTDFGTATAPKDLTFVDMDGEEGENSKESAQKLLKEFNRRLLLYTSNTLSEEHQLRVWQMKTKENAKILKRKRQEHEKKLKDASKLAKIKQKEKQKKKKEKELKLKQKEKEKQKAKLGKAKTKQRVIKDRAGQLKVNPVGLRAPDLKMGSGNNKRKLDYMMMDKPEMFGMHHKRGGGGMLKKPDMANSASLMMMHLDSRKLGNNEDIGDMDDVDVGGSSIHGGQQKRARHMLPLLSNPTSYVHHQIQLEWNNKWHVAQVMNFDENTQLHTVRYADGVHESYFLLSTGVAMSADEKESTKWQLLHMQPPMYDVRQQQPQHQQQLDHQNEFDLPLNSQFGQFGGEDDLDSFFNGYPSRRNQQSHMMQPAPLRKFG